MTPNLSEVPSVCHKEHLYGQRNLYENLLHLYGQRDLYENLSIKLALEALDSATHLIDTQISPYQLFTSLPVTQDSKFYKKQNVAIFVSFPYAKKDSVLVSCHWTKMTSHFLIQLELQSHVTCPSQEHMHQLQRMSGYAVCLFAWGEMHLKVQMT